MIYKVDLSEKIADLKSGKYENVIENIQEALFVIYELLEKIVELLESMQPKS